jgi:hypothetical protein
METVPVGGVVSAAGVVLPARVQEATVPSTADTEGLDARWNRVVGGSLLRAAVVWGLRAVRLSRRLRAGDPWQDFSGISATWIVGAAIRYAHHLVRRLP